MNVMGSAPRILAAAAGSFLIAAGFQCGTADGGSAEKGVVVHSLDLTHYDPAHTPPSLSIANETLVLPLRPGAPSRALSRAEPGDLQVPYTRAGCWTPDPQETLARVSVPVQTPIKLLSINIDQELSPGNSSTLQELAKQTCLTYRTAAGSWEPLIAPTTITVGADGVRAEFTSPAVETDAFAIFLPTYTNVKRITYTVVEPVR
ncbi:hypothetical protein [Pendulispora albinea]|uniref:Uncharacterized protein n=1 Tax=Pendulispora albinea TaxID=2741071 RepID=A0ABZ2M021_9BACT